MVRGIRYVSARVATALLVSSAFVFAPGVPIAQAGADSTYVVLYGSQAVPAGAARHIQLAGGSVVATYPEIGVAIARSSNASFTTQVKSDGLVAGVSTTRGFGSQLKKSEPDSAGSTETGDFP